MLSECDGINILEWGAGQIVGRKKFHRLTSPYSTEAPLYCARIEFHSFEFDQANAKYKKARLPRGRQKKGNQQIVCQYCHHLKLIAKLQLYYRIVKVS
jgi:hypothetical protein